MTKTTERMNTDVLFEIARRHGLNLVGDVRTNEMGLDFLVAFAGDHSGAEWVLRVPRRAGMIDKIEVESRVLTFAASQLNLAVPAWKVVSSELIAYPLLPWPTVMSFDSKTFELTWNIDKDAPRLVPTLAEALAQMHSIDPDEARAAGIKVSTPDQCRKQTFDDIYYVKSALGISSQLETRLKNWLDDDSLWPPRSAFVHGDLYVGHILAELDGSVRGMIDWSESEVSDPSIDFTGHFNVFGREGLKDLLRVYENRGGLVWPKMVDHISERAAVAPIRYAIFALASKEESLLNRARELLSVDS